MTNFVTGKLYYSPELKDIYRLFNVDTNSLCFKYFIDTPDGDGVESHHGDATYVQDLWGREEILAEIKDLEEQIAHLKEMLPQVEIE